MNSNDGMVMWLLGGAGVFLLYSAYKNQQPQALLASYVNGQSVEAPISNYGGSQTPRNPAPYVPAPGEKGLDTFAHNGLIAPSSTSTRQDISGTWNVVDASGRMIGVVPDRYQNTPSLYIPAVSA